MTETQKIDWIPSGTLKQLETHFAGGVYIFVYRGPPPRLIYVGTAKASSGFTPRWCEHLKLFAVGGRTVWRPDRESDIYDYMRSRKKSDYEAWAGERKIWVPSNRKSGGYYLPYFEDGGDYRADWRAYVLDEYLGRIEVWGCELSNEREALILETKIQHYFSEKHHLGFYSTRSSQTWLGKQEVTDASVLDDHRFESGRRPVLQDGELSMPDVL